MIRVGRSLSNLKLSATCPLWRNNVESMIYCSFSRPLHPYRRAALQLGKAPSCLSDSDSGHLEARVNRVRQHDKLLRHTTGTLLRLDSRADSDVTSR